MKYSKILLAALSFAFFQSCSDDEIIIKVEPDNAHLQESYNVQRLKIIPIEPSNSDIENTTYVWKLENEIIGNEKMLGFVSDKPGTYDLTLEIKSGSTSKTLRTKVNVTQETVTYNKYISKVFDYLPAVGQFINELPIYQAGDTQANMNAKAGDQLIGKETGLISLGGYGGYVVFGFDHTILNQKDKRDFKILGNGFAGSSEPGIIMVAYDKNKNGKPDDDEWYEIAGSEYNNPTTIKNYIITYNKPTVEEPKAISEYIKWEDNQGNSGYKVKNGFNKQPYYPLWFGSDQLKLSGTLLANNYTEKNGIWTGKQLAYGYADNAANNSEDSNIDIDWAVDKNGKPVKLLGIDFIKVYTATNQEAGWLGEISTEVAGAYDLHL
ncbi:PKD-like domain-containing protein [Empedobacter brevis]|uniref:PKD-like domain-containing protein n=1 Tax=Empedobacter brevis TaxID=247 RepID=UPI0039AF5650